MSFHILVHVEVAVGVHPHGVGPVAPAGVQGALTGADDVAVDAEDAHESIKLRDVENVVLVDVDVAGPRQTGPFVQIFSVRVEDLDPVILPVGDEHPAIGVHPNAVGHVELARPGLPRLAPGEKQFAAGRELMDAGGTAAVGI